jgi:hypothetical protein
MVNAIWSDMDLRYPPAVERLSRRATATIASANRLSLSLPDRTPAWCLLHELAHSMSTTVDGRSDMHGPAFMDPPLSTVRASPAISVPLLAESG